MKIFRRLCKEATSRSPSSSPIILNWMELSWNYRIVIYFVCMLITWSSAFSLRRTWKCKRSRICFFYVHLIYEGKFSNEGFFSLTIKYSLNLFPFSITLISEKWMTWSVYDGQNHPHLSRKCFRYSQILIRSITKIKVLIKTKYNL